MSEGGGDDIGKIDRSRLPELFSPLVVFDTRSHVAEVGPVLFYEIKTALNV